MVNWFGPHAWSAAICTDAPRCDIPIGVACARCGVVFSEASSGITMPGSPAPVAYHLDCQMKSVLPHTLWAAAGLVPDATDGLKDGAFECESCGMFYREGFGWALRPRL
jgi:hypothetical protein